MALYDLGSRLAARGAVPPWLARPLVRFCTACNMGRHGHWYMEKLNTNLLLFSSLYLVLAFESAVSGAGILWTASWFTPVVVVIFFGLPDIVNLFAYVDSIEMRRSQEAVDMVIMPPLRAPPCHCTMSTCPMPKAQGPRPKAQGPTTWWRCGSPPPPRPPSPQVHREMQLKQALRVLKMLLQLHTFTERRDQLNRKRRRGTLRRSVHESMQQAHALWEELLDRLDPFFVTVRGFCHELGLFLGATTESVAGVARRTSHAIATKLHVKAGAGAGAGGGGGARSLSNGKLTPSDVERGSGRRGSGGGCGGGSGGGGLGGIGERGGGGAGLEETSAIAERLSKDGVSKDRISKDLVEAGFAQSAAEAEELAAELEFSPATIKDSLLADTTRRAEWRELFDLIDAGFDTTQQLFLCEKLKEAYALSFVEREPGLADGLKTDDRGGVTDGAISFIELASFLSQQPCLPECYVSAEELISDIKCANALSFRPGWSCPSLTVVYPPCAGTATRSRRASRGRRPRRQITAAPSDRRSTTAIWGTRAAGRRAAAWISTRRRDTASVASGAPCPPLTTTAAAAAAAAAVAVAAVAAVAALMLVAAMMLAERRPRARRTRRPSGSASGRRWRRRRRCTRRRISRPRGGASRPRPSGGTSTTRRGTSRPSRSSNGLTRRCSAPSSSSSASRPSAASRGAARQ